LRCLALNDPKIAMAVRPLVSREYAKVARDPAANAKTDPAVRRKCLEAKRAGSSPALVS